MDIAKAKEWYFEVRAVRIKVWMFSQSLIHPSCEKAVLCVGCVWAECLTTDLGTLEPLTLVTFSWGVAAVLFFQLQKTEVYLIYNVEYGAVIFWRELSTISTEFSLQGLELPR